MKYSRPFFYTLELPKNAVIYFMHGSLTQAVWGQVAHRHNRAAILVEREYH